MNKTIISIGIVAVAIAGIVWIARPGPAGDVSSSEKSKGTLVVEEANNYDFGSISMAAGDVSHVFKIRNTGSDAVTITKMYTSCMCTTAILTNGDKQFGPFGMPGHAAIPKIDQIISPDAEAEVEVIFDPAAHGPAGVGRIERVVTVENNAGQPVELLFAAMVTP